MRAFIAILAACALAHPFGLEFEDDDLSYGHHGRPANYKAMEGIVHPLGKSKNVIVMDPLEALRSFGFDMEMASYGMMDPFGEHSAKPSEKTAQSDAAGTEEDEDDEAMMLIMESTPEMCPLCAKDGHSLGHEGHKKFLARLRQKLLGDSKKEKKKGEDSEMARMVEAHLGSGEGAMGETRCPLCRAEGHAENHAAHLALMKLAKETTFEPKKKAESREFGCSMCRHEGTDMNHGKHLQLAQMLKRKAELDGMGLADKEQSYKSGLKHIMERIDEHRDIMIAAMAEAQFSRDRRQRVPFAPAAGMTFEFVFEEEPSMMLAKGGSPFADDLMTFAEPFDMMKMARADPPRDFRRRAGEPADDSADEDDDMEESLWEKIVRNIRDLFGMGEGSSTFADDGESRNLGAILAMLLLLFVGLLLVSFGLVELLSVVLGERDGSAGYEPLGYDAEERMILNMEDGSVLMSMQRGKGSVQI